MINLMIGAKIAPCGTPLSTNQVTILLIGLNLHSLLGSVSSQEELKQPVSITDDDIIQLTMQGRMAELDRGNYLKVCLNNQCQHHYYRFRVYNFRPAHQRK